MDNRNYIIANLLVGNKENTPAIEFAYQGPLLSFKGKTVCFVITGEVNFNILRKENQTEQGKCYQTYSLLDGDQINILSTNKSVYGYLAVSGGLDAELYWNSCSVNTKAKIGANDGEKIKENDQIIISKKDQKYNYKKLDHINSKIEHIRVIKGTNYNYFSQEAKNVFFSKEYTISKFTDRMGMRLKGSKIENIINTNITSEGLIKGVIQIPPDGNPIIMLSDHGTIGGYPKIGVIISADYDKLVQLTPGSKIKFKLVELSEAETLFKLYNMETQKILNQLK